MRKPMGPGLRQPSQPRCSMQKGFPGPPDQEVSPIPRCGPGFLHQDRDYARRPLRSCHCSRNCKVLLSFVPFAVTTSMCSVPSNRLSTPPFVPSPSSPALTPSSQRTAVAFTWCPKFPQCQSGLRVVGRPAFPKCHPRDSASWCSSAARQGSTTWCFKTAHGC